MSSPATRHGRNAATALQFQLRSRWSTSKGSKTLPFINTRQLPLSNHNTMSRRAFGSACSTSRGSNRIFPVRKMPNSNRPRQTQPTRLASSSSKNETSKDARPIHKPSKPRNDFSSQSRPSPSSISNPQPPQPPPTTPEPTTPDLDIPILTFQTSRLKYPIPLRNYLIEPAPSPTTFHRLWTRYDIHTLSRLELAWLKLIAAMPRRLQLFVIHRIHLDSRRVPAATQLSADQSRVRLHDDRPWWWPRGIVVYSVGLMGFVLLYPWLVQRFDRTGADEVVERAERRRKKRKGPARERGVLPVVDGSEE